MNTRLNIKKLDGNIVQKHGGSKQVGFKQLGPGVETGVHGVHDEKRVWFEVELQGAQGDRKAESGLSKVLWTNDTTMSTYLVNKVKVKRIFLGYRKRNMGFNESGKYKKTFISSGVGTCSMKVLQEDEFKVEPQDDHTFEVEPHGNVDHVVGSQEYREDTNEAAFAVAVVEKIYAHESLTFNDIVACEVISKWKARLKDDMDARSDV
ncbi:hypothetical protein Tco_0298905 [Tanacetum coccineum]